MEGVVRGQRGVHAICMDTSKAQKPREVAKEWRGFPGRLRYAIEQRKLENPELTQNQIAAASMIDGGNLAKMLKGEKVVGVTANTVVLLAKALDVRAAWLLTGEEPSGLGQATPVPSSAVRPSSKP